MTDQPFNSESEDHGDVSTSHIPAPVQSIFAEVATEAAPQEAQPEAPQETTAEALIEEAAEVQPAVQTADFMNAGVIAHQPEQVTESPVTEAEPQAVEPAAEATPVAETEVVSEPVVTSAVQAAQELADPVTETAPVIPAVEPYRGRLSEEFTPQEQAEASIQANEQPVAGVADASKKKSMRGFASMTPERRREIAARGGASVPKERRAYSQNPELARAAGKKGGSVKGKTGPRGPRKPKPETVAPAPVQEAVAPAPVEQTHIEEVGTETVQYTPVADVTSIPVETQVHVEPAPVETTPVAVETPPTE